MFSVAGVLGLVFLRQTLHRLTSSGDEWLPLPTQFVEGEQPSTPESKEILASSARGPLDMPAGQTLGRHTRSVFACWMIVFALVGAQMGWVLRPFIGAPHLKVTWFRERKSNFFEAVLNALEGLFSNGA
jgi:hypothetical protein